MFTITDGKGFWIDFANGWKVSVQWGVGNYCDYHGTFSSPFVPAQGPSKTAEVGVKRDGGEWFIYAYQTPEQVAEIIQSVAKRERDDIEEE